ncbi:MAG: hypothetical protein MJ071_04070 [Oscillospiraceae bacterium]|nr:hypothetical protein [Oscillospiraceae bacterium]
MAAAGLLSLTSCSPCLVYGPPPAEEESSIFSEDVQEVYGPPPADAEENADSALYDNSPEEVQTVYGPPAAQD